MNFEIVTAAVCGTAVGVLIGRYAFAKVKVLYQDRIVKREVEVPSRTFLVKNEDHEFGSAKS